MSVINTMGSKQQLKKYLSEISENAEFPLFNYVSAEKYTILIKCRVETNRSAQFYSEYTKEWIKKFAKFTKTSWIVRACFPNVKRFLYRKVFACHHSSFNKRKTPEQSGAKDKQCKAKIDFKIKFINRNTIRNDKLLKDGLNLTIHINFVHSHGIAVREIFSLLKCSADTDEIFYKYFADGHTTGTAKSYHKLTLLSNFGANSEHLSNAEINPTLRHAKYLFNKKKKEGLSFNIADIMSDRMKVLEESGGVLRHTDDYGITVVITPFMKNVISGHELDCIIVDSTPIKECVVSFLLVPTSLGALPIACTLHSQNTEPSFSQAFFSTKLLLENQTLKSFEPSKIMINQIDEQNHALDAIFSNKSLFLSRVSLLEGIWRTICEGEVKIERKHRHKVMELFTSLLYAENFKEAELYYKELEGNSDVQSADARLKEYLCEVWNRREDYIAPNKVIDISLRTLKQFILCRCSSYNSLIMIDVLMNILDNHWCEILHAHLRGKLIIETYMKFLPRDKMVLESLAGLEMTGQEYRLDKTKGHVTFRADTMCCDCVKGRRGEFCEHLCAALHSVVIKTSVPEDKRAFYTALAGEHQVKLEPDNPQLEYDEENKYDMDETVSNNNEQYFTVKEEIDNDPLNDSNSDTEDSTANSPTEIDKADVKENYVNALRALNDEFRRLSKVFRENPSASNLDTMGRLARELSKIKPVEKINFGNMFVEEVKENGTVID